MFKIYEILEKDDRLCGIYKKYKDEKKKDSTKNKCHEHFIEINKQIRKKGERDNDCSNYSFYQ